MEKNKTGKYFKYAVGEIILVVIGILIALQINNWNEAKKIQETEIQLYKNALLDLKEEAKNIATNIKWFKGFQDTYYSIYKESIGIHSDEPITYSDILWSNFFRPLISEQYGDNMDNLGNEIIQKLFREVIWREKLTIESMNEWNLNKMNIVRPFLSKYGIFNADNIYRDKKYEFMRLKDSSFVDRERLISQYGTNEFKQILYDGKYKSSWVLRCLENLKIANKNLIIGLEAIIDNDINTLKSIKSVDSYY